MEEAKNITGSGSPAQPVIRSLPPMMNLNVGNIGETTPTPSPPPPPPLPLHATMTTMPTPALGITGGGIGEGQGQGQGQGQGKQSFGLLEKKKRGRPRKYDSEGNLRVGYQSASRPPKRDRGRPPNSTTWQLLASLVACTAGGDFTPHVVTAYSGEDVAGKIYSFAQKSLRAVCILSAVGAISKVTISQPGSSSGTLTYEGRFEILSLSGSLTVSDSGEVKSGPGGLSVLLSGSDGRVIGGVVAGLLTASGPIQIVIGSYLPSAFKIPRRKFNREHTAASRASGAPNTGPAAGSISQANPDGENIPRPTPQLPEQAQSESANITSDQLNLDATPSSVDWNVTEDFSDQGPSPDINISLPDE